jgi:hypothetical protein
MLPLRVRLAVWRGSAVEDPADAPRAAAHAGDVLRRLRARTGRPFAVDFLLLAGVTVGAILLTGFRLSDRIGLALLALGALLAAELVRHTVRSRRMRNAARAERANVAVTLHTIALRHARPRDEQGRRRALRLVA